MDTLDKLLWIEEIRQLKSRYFRFMDTKDWGALRTVFCDDATFDCRTAMNLTGKGEGGRAAESNDCSTRAATASSISSAPPSAPSTRRITGTATRSKCCPPKMRAASSRWKTSCGARTSAS